MDIYFQYRSVLDNILIDTTSIAGEDFATQTTLATLLTRANLLLADSTFTSEDFAQESGGNLDEKWVNLIS